MSPAAAAGRLLGVLGLAAAVGAGLSLAGCTGTTPNGARSDGASATSVQSSAPPGPASAAVDQFRDDYASGTIVMQITDTGSGPFTAVRAELTDPRFAGGAVWTGSTAFTPGQTTSLPAPAAAPVCPGIASTTATPSTQGGATTITLYLADGTEHRLAADDPHGVLARIHADGCFAASVATSVSLTLDDALSPGAAADTALLTLRVGQPAPQASPPRAPAPANVTLVSVAGTTLLDQDPAQPWPRGVVLSPGTAVQLAVRPARCDPHAVAEDKVGTLIPLTLSAGQGTSGVVKVAASPALRAAVYAFVGTACGWPAG